MGSGFCGLFLPPLLPLHSVVYFPLLFFFTLSFPAVVWCGVKVVVVLTMGGLCSKNVTPKPNPYAKGRAAAAAAAAYYHSNGNNDNNNSGNYTTKPSVSPAATTTDVAITSKARKSVDKRLPEPPRRSVELPLSSSSYTSNGNNEDFYDGIPRYSSFLSRSSRSTQAAVAKVSEVSSRLGKAGTVGLGKAVEVLDTLGSSVANLNPNAGFAAALTTKGNELGILAFEVANTVVKGSNLMESLSKRSIRHLKEIVLPSDGIQNLISQDMDELLRIVASDKREELKVFSSEVVRFGNRSKDPQWHNLDRYFDKISREISPNRQLKAEAESVIDPLMTLVQYTAELYHELQVLDRMEQECENKRRVKGATAGLAILKAELKSQTKLIRNLKKKSLWSRSLEEVMEKLVDVVHFLVQEIHVTFPSADSHVEVQESTSSHMKLGPAGLSLHYANVVMQIDTIVARSSSMPPNARDTLYQNLPPSVKSALRFKLQSFDVDEELTISEIKEEMEKTLEWLVPVATNTAKAHHGFGWVGEWANARTEVNSKPTSAPAADIIRIETFHHADKEKTEAYILELLLWLNHLVSMCKPGIRIGDVKVKPSKGRNAVPVSKSNNQPKQECHAHNNATSLTTEEQKLLHDSCKIRRVRGDSRSVDLDQAQKSSSRLRKHERLSKSSGHEDGLRKENKGIVGSMKRLPSSVIPIIAFGTEKERALDIIDRVDEFR